MSTDIELVRDDVVKDLSRERPRFGGLNIWNIYSHVYDFLPRYFRPYQKLLADVITVVESNTPKGGKVLDSGCGTGNFSLGLGLRGYKVEGLDISRAMLRRAILKKKKAGLENIDFKEWDLEKGLALYHDATFDCVISVHSLYTLREPEAAIREYFRVLKPSGRFIMVEPQSSIKVIPIAKEIYREGGLKDVLKLLVTQSGVGICNLLIGKRLTNCSYHYWDEQTLRSTLLHTKFRMNTVAPAYMASSDLIAIAVKSGQYYEKNGYRFLSAESREDLEKVWRLRYQVYCVELGFEPENPNELENDKYDEHAINFLAVDENDKAVGTIRLVPNNPLGFPMDTDFSLTDYMKTHDILSAFEIGRFAIPKYVRREDRVGIALGLFKCLYDYCIETRTYDLFAVTNPKTIEKYIMPGVEIIAEPFRYSKPLTGGLWVPVHANIVSAREYEKHLRTRRDSAGVV